jgi:hypothetical protein
MDRAIRSDEEARGADAEKLVGLLLLRQAVVTRAKAGASPELPIYKAARDSAAAEVRFRLKEYEWWVKHSASL